MKTLSELEKICEAATPGRWIQGKSGGAVVAVDSYLDSFETRQFYGGDVIGESMLLTNRQFVIAAHENMPRLIRLLKEARLWLGTFQCAKVVTYRANAPTGPGNMEFSWDDRDKLDKLINAIDQPEEA